MLARAPRPASAGRLVPAAPPTQEAFSADYERCFGRVYAYVSRRVSDLESCERIVSDVLETNLDLFVHRLDERQEICRLKATSDRLIGLDSAKGVAPGRAGP